MSTITTHARPDAVTLYASIADKYEKSTGGATRHIAAKIVSWSPEFTASSQILDNACGTGIVVEELQKHLSAKYGTDNFSVPVIAADAAPPMINALKAKLEAGKDRWTHVGPVTTHAVIAEELGASIVPSNSITHSYTNFGIFFCKDPVQAGSHIYRTLAPGGTAFISCWNDFGYDGTISEALKEANPESEGINFPFGDGWKDPAYFKDILVKAGFAGGKVEVRQEDSFYRAESAKSVAGWLLEQLGRIMSPQDTAVYEKDRAAFVEIFAKHLENSDHVVQDNSDGFAFRMRANIAVCTK